MNYTIMVLAAYAVIMIAATVLMTNKEKSVERFCVGNRNTGWFISALSIAATWIWAPALFTSTENAYTKGFAGLFWFLVPNVLCLIFFIPFARRIRKEMPEGITLSGYMHQKYQSESVKNIYLFQLGALSALSTGVQLLAGSKILSMLTGIPFWIMTVIMGCDCLFVFTVLWNKGFDTDGFYTDGLYVDCKRLLLQFSALRMVVVFKICSRNWRIYRRVQLPFHLQKA